MTGITTRRHFLQATLATLAPLALAACGATAAATTSASSATALTSSVSGSATSVTGAATTAASSLASATSAAVTTAAASSPAAAAKPPAANSPALYIWSNMINHDPAQGTAPDKLKQVTQYIADRTNANLVAYIPPTDGTTATTKLNLLLSGGQPLDIFQGNWDQYQQVALPITKLLDTAGGSIRSRFSADLWAKMTDASGQIWGIPRLALQTKAQPIWFRTDWLKELNLAMPATFADLENTLAAFQKRNANASLATSSIGDFRYATVGGFTEFGYSNWLDKTDNKLKPAELQPGYQDWVASMAGWYKKGWLNKGTFANPGIPRDEALVKTGNLGVWAGWYSRLTLYFNPKDSSAVPGMQFDVQRQGIKGTAGFMETFNPGGTGAILVSKLSKNPDSAVHFLNWQYQMIENSMTAEYGIPDVDWKWADSQHLYFDRPTAGTPQAYAGEYMASSGPWSESQTIPNDPLLKEHYLYIHNDNTNYTGGKAQVDIAVPYNSADIRKQVPGLADLSTLIDQETVKFITGVRSLTEWSGFLGQLQSAGLNDWITAYTAQYMKFQK